MRLGLLLLFSALFCASAPAAITPEQQTIQMARALKPFSDEMWSEVAGTKLKEEYEITKGDTLYDISKRLFGDPKYWPKIWAVNNGKIKNPHVIVPGKKVAFMPGTGTSLPAMSLGKAGGQAETVVA